MDRAVELDPEDARSYDARGWCHKLCHYNDLALADFDRAIALKPLEPEYRCRRGLVWLEKGELLRALEDLDHAIRLQPENGRYYHERAKALLYENPAVRPEDALPDLEQAIRLEPEKAWYRMDRGYIRYYLGQWSEAAEDFLCQNFRYMYSIAPYLGAERVVWIYLARLFEGHPAFGVDAIEEYLNWYLTEPAGPGQDQPPAERLETWPVPLSRFLKGDLNESQLLGRTDLDPTRADLELWQLEEINNCIGECHFVLAQQRIAQANLGEASLHLRKARGLPPRNPMRWVVERQIACYG